MEMSGGGLRLASFADLQARMARQSELMRLAARDAAAPVTNAPPSDCDPSARELRRLTHDVRSLSASVEGNRARLEALREQTEAIGTLALEVSMLASTTNLAFIRSSVGDRSSRSSGQALASARASVPVQTPRAYVHAEEELDASLTEDGERPTTHLSWAELMRGRDFEAIEHIRDALDDLDVPRGVPRGVLETALKPHALLAAMSDCCAICLAPMLAGESAVALACSHTFHCSCVREAAMHRAACPICRRVIPW
ncbi:hypothetical protein KFE25_000083 [Diacronema lutheri]|uniref:RING-type domain-containing protein n=1 Tax=Diacronema lutheri TaxID=2081491 RepID=A0A8J5XR48_DIALT|nr:hypothetical protein KFE25_000083 [Diacronema lutheri]